MAGFTPQGGISGTVSSAEKTVVFSLRSSVGKELKVYTVSSDEADAFEKNMLTELPQLQAEAGESLSLIRMSKCF